MIVLFAFAFAGHVLMLLTGLVRSAVFHSRTYREMNSYQTRVIEKIRLRKHWRITWILFGLYVYAGLNL